MLPIPSLFFRGRPSTVFRLIIAIAIRESVNRMLRCRLRTHIGKEVFEVVPSLTHNHAFALIQVIIRPSLVRPMAASHHTEP